MTTSFIDFQDIYEYDRINNYISKYTDVFTKTISHFVRILMIAILRSNERKILSRARVDRNIDFSLSLSIVTIDLSFDHIFFNLNRHASGSSE